MECIRTGKVQLDYREHVYIMYKYKDENPERRAYNIHAPGRSLYKLLLDTATGIYGSNRGGPGGEGEDRAETCAPL